MTPIMAKIKFLQDDLEIEVPVGTLVQDAVEKSGASLPFGCRMGSCGTCRCLVTKGMQNLNKKTDEEKDLFETLTSVHENERLCCQLTVEKEGEIEIQH